jgi:hypothetical protein
MSDAPEGKEKDAPTFSIKGAIDPVPPLAAKVIVSVTGPGIGVHWAYKVAFEVGENADPALNVVPVPFATEFHPLKVLPTRAGVGRVRALEPTVKFKVDGVTVPPSAL